MNKRKSLEEEIDSSRRVSMAQPIDEALLFDPDRIRRPELWKFIKLVAPSTKLPDGKKQWSSKDAVKAYCLKCQRSFGYKSGTSQQVARHMQQHHDAEFGAVRDERLLFDPERLRRPEIWQFIKLVAPSVKLPSGKSNWTSKDATKAFCLKCQRSFGYKSGTSQQVTRHMEEHHFADLEEFAEKQRKRSLLKEKGMSNTPSKKLKKTYKTALGQEKGTNLLAEWIADSYRPLDIVDDKKFEEFVQFLSLSGQDFRIPTKSTLRSTIIARKRSMKEEMQIKMSADMLWYSLMVDIWTSNSEKNYLILKVFFLTEDFVRESCVLSVTPFDGQCTSEVVQAVIELELKQWNLNKMNMTLLLGNGFEIRTAGELMGIPSLDCIAFTLETAVSSFLGNEDDANVNPASQPALTYVSSIVAHVRDITLYFEQNQSAQNALSSLQTSSSDGEEQKLARNKSIVGDTKDCWSSTLKMLRRTARLHDTLQIFFEKNERGEFGNDNSAILSISAEEWLVIEGVITLLEPLEFCAAALSEEVYPVWPMSLPYLRKLRRTMESDDLIESMPCLKLHADEPYFKSIVGKLKVAQKHISGFLNSQYAPIDDEFLWIMPLDPRFSKLPEVQDEEKARIHQALIDAVSKTTSIRPPSYLDDELDAAHIDSIKTGEWSLRSVGGWGDQSESVETGDPNSEDATTEVYNYFDSLRYCPEDSLIWWKVNRMKFPRLAQLARKWLGAVAARKTSKQAFSSTDTAVIHRFEALESDLQDSCLFLHENFDRMERTTTEPGAGIWYV